MGSATYEPNAINEAGKVETVEIENTPIKIQVAGENVHPVIRVRRFHQVYGAPIAERPEIPSAEQRLLRVRLILEEAMEFAAASGYPLRVYVLNEEAADGKSDVVTLLEQATTAMCKDEAVDLLEVADALGDLNVVVNGSALVWGIPIASIDAEVDASNMSKLMPDGTVKQREDGKVLKGPNYFKPDIADVLRMHGWEGDGL